MCAHRQLVAGFVEADVAVAADAEQLQIDAAGGDDRGLIALAFSVQIVGPAIKEMNSLGADVNAIEEMTLHESTEASRVTSVDASEFVEIEGRRPRPVGVPCRVHPLKLQVAVNGRPPGREAENSVWFRLQRRRHTVRKRRCYSGTAIEHGDRHKVRLKADPTDDACRMPTGLYIGW